MGVDYYNCSHCGEIYADCGTYKSCEHCGGSACANCMDDVDFFEFQGEHYCDLCWEDEIPIYDDGELLNYLLNKYKRTRDEIENELPKKKPKHRYYCKEKHNCGSVRCDLIYEDFYSENDWELPSRGICCLEHKLIAAERCSACLIKPKLITFLCCMKKMNVLPRDIVVMIGKLIIN